MKIASGNADRTVDRPKKQEADPAHRIRLFFITEGGSTNTNGFKIIDDYVIFRLK